MADSESIEALSARYGTSYRWLVTLTVMSGSVTFGLASSIVNVAVPTVMGAFGVGLDQAQWMATGFLAAMSASMLLSSWLIEVLVSVRKVLESYESDVIQGSYRRMEGKANVDIRKPRFL
jgi:MFS family permease